MPDLGPHAIFIWSAYGVTFVTVVALAFSIIADDRWQRGQLADLERRGIRRRSAPASSAEPVTPKPRAKGRARKTPQA
jgi:heme exporter protein D